MIVRQVGQMDGTLVTNAIKEADSIFSVQVTVQRWTSTTPGNGQQGIKDVQNYTPIQCMAVIDELTAEEIIGSANLYSAGDVHIQIPIKINGGSNVGNRPADLIIYNGDTYRIIGKPYPVTYAGAAWWKAVIRQGASS